MSALQQQKLRSKQKHYLPASVAMLVPNVLELGTMYLTAENKARKIGQKKRNLHVCLQIVRSVMGYRDRITHNDYTYLTRQKQHTETFSGNVGHTGVTLGA